MHSLPPCPLSGAHDCLGCSPLYACPPLPSPLHTAPSTKNQPEPRPAVCRNQHPGPCGKGSVGTFILVSLPLCFQSNRISVNKHQTWNTVQAPPSAPYLLPPHPHGALKGLSAPESSVQWFCSQFSNPCCPRVRDSVLCWRAGEAGGQPERCSHPSTGPTWGPKALGPLPFLPIPCEPFSGANIHIHDQPGGLRDVWQTVKSSLPAWPREGRS